MSLTDPMFWVMVIVAVSFVVIAGAMVFMALVVRRVITTVSNLEKRAEPLFERVAMLSDQVQQIALQGKEVAAQVNQLSAHLVTATMHFSESAALIKEEVREMRQVVGLSAEMARDKITTISQTIDRTHQQVSATTIFVQSKLVEPAREIAAIMAGLRRGLEVLVGPAPKPINRTYGDDEMFIG